jgi:hypothetical protein
MKTLIKIFLTILPALYLGNAYADAQTPVNGTVINSTTKQGLVGAEIIFLNQDKEEISEDYEYSTGTNGKFTLDNIPEDAQYIQIIFEGYTTQDITLSEFDEAAPIELKPDIKYALDKAKSARETENSDVNKLLGSVGMGATGIGGMMLTQGLSEKAADDDATRAMQAYISTFNCTYGNNRVAGGTVAEIPGGNELIALYSEYVNLANNLKSVKNELGMRPGIESEPILDSATSGLYDDVSVGGTSGAYASLARALMNPNGTDAAAWSEQTEKTSKNITTGAITAGAGAGVSMIGDLTNKLVEKKKAEKSTQSK